MTQLSAQIAAGGFGPGPADSVLIGESHRLVIRPSAIPTGTGLW
jgi:hypothetical protein